MTKKTSKAPCFDRSSPCNTMNLRSSESSPQIGPLDETIKEMCQLTTWVATSLLSIASNPKPYPLFLHSYLDRRLSSLSANNHQSQNIFGWAQHVAFIYSICSLCLIRKESLDAGIGCSLWACERTMDCKASIFTAPDLAREAKRRAFVKCNKTQCRLKMPHLSLLEREQWSNPLSFMPTQDLATKILIKIDTASMNHPTGEDLLKIVNDQFFRPTSQACAT